MITIYTIAYNEEVFLKFMIDHYRERFPTCKIVVFDNESTDSTKQIALDNDCEVITHKSNNKIDDNLYLKVKNNCWKTAKTDWVLICDVDELLDITEEQLIAEDKAGKTIIKSEAYNMVNMEDNYDLPNIKYGSRCDPYDKYYLFNKSKLKEINYTHGCHTANPKGKSIFSDKSYKLYHYKCINPDFMVERYRMYNARLSSENIKHGWGYQYTQSEKDVRESMLLARTYVIKVRE